MQKKNNIELEMASLTVDGMANGASNNQQVFDK